MRRLAAVAAPLLALAAATVVTGPAIGAADAARPKQWHLDTIGAPVAGADADGVVVAVVDSGVDLDHPDLAGRLVPGIDLVEDDAEADDEFGHGSHVAGILGASIGGGEAVGVTPAVRIMPVRVLDEEGAGLLSDVVEGVRWAVDHGAQVVNLSLGEDTQAVLGPSFGQVLREAWAQGVIPVVAAGNQFVTGSGFSDEPAVVVSATNRRDEKPTYASGVGSARWGMAAPGGDPPELSADGAILSTYLDGGYAWVAGTSQAAPMVSATLAALLGLGLSPQEAVDRVLATAVDLGPPGRDSTFGTGRLDVRRAVDGLVRPTHASPPSTERAAPRPTTTAAEAGPADATTTTVTTTTKSTEQPAPDDEAAAGAAAPDRPGRGGGDGGDDVPLPLAALAAGLAAGVGMTARRQWARQRS